MPTKALSCKKEAICEHGPEAPSCPVGQGSFKMDCFKVEKCYMVRRVQIWHSCWKSWTPEERGERPFSMLSAFSSKSSTSDGMWVHKCIRYGQLGCFGRHYECWKVNKGFRSTYAPLQTTSISWKALCISAGRCKTTYSSYYNSMASWKKSPGAELACLQSGSFTYREHLEHH